MVRRRYLWLIAVCAACLMKPVALRADQAADEAAIRKNADDYVSAYNRRDAQALAAFWSPEAVYANPITGEEVTGRAAIADQFAAVFAELDDGKLEVEVNSVEFLSPNVGVEHGTATVVLPDGQRETSDYSAVHVKRDGKWLLDRVSEAEAPMEPPSNYEHLKELEWMIGSWLDADQNASVLTDCKWARNQNFITRSFAAVVGDQVEMAGIQVIGWDPVANQIRSWVFDSTGGFGEGKWTREGDRWFIHTVGTTPDGTRNSAVNIIKYVDDNSCTWQSVDRESDGEMLPNVEEVVLTRIQSAESSDVGGR